MYNRSIIFTKTPLLKAYRYKDIFQLVPISYATSAPISLYTCHFPAFLEYKSANEETVLFCENEFRKKGVSEEILKLSRSIPSQTRTRKEILHLLSSLTNFHFFEYDYGYNCWGIQVPMKNVNDLNDEELEKLNNQVSHWTIRSYIYPKLAEDLKIDELTNCNDYFTVFDKPIDYFTISPNLYDNPEIKIPPYFDFVLDNYYSLKENERNIVRQCIGLLFEGIELFDTKKSVSLLSIVSSIEGMAKLDHTIYGKGEKIGPTKRFVNYLKTYVAGKSEEKFINYYKKRCNITHDGTLFLSDLDLYGDINQQDSDWRFRLEVLQAARLSLYNWLRR